MQQVLHLAAVNLKVRLVLAPAWRMAAARGEQSRGRQHTPKRPASTGFVCTGPAHACLTAALELQQRAHQRTHGRMAQRTWAFGFVAIGRLGWSGELAAAELGAHRTRRKLAFVPVLFPRFTIMDWAVDQ